MVIDTTRERVMLGLLDLPELEGATGPAVFSDGPCPARVMIVGEAPGAKEEAAWLPFVENGDSGHLLNEILEKAGLKRSEIFVTNAVKRRPLKPDGTTRNPTTKEVEAWAPILWQEIEQVQPAFILLLGNAALKAVHPESRTITRVRGMIRQHDKGFKTLATLHPAAVLRKRDTQPIVENDIRLFGQLVRGEEPVAPTKTHRVIRSVNALFNLVEQLLSAEEFAVDIETRSFDWMTDPILCMIFSSAPNEAYVVPLLGEQCREIWSGEEKEGVVELLKEVLASDVPKIFQNGTFDVKFLEHNGFKVNNFAFDTLIEHHLLDENLPHDLKFLASYELGEPTYDEELRQYLTTKSITFDQAPEKVLWKYAAYDADSTLSLHRKFTEQLKEETPRAYGYYVNTLMPLTRALTNMELRGVTLDEEWLGSAKTEFEEEAARLEKEIFIEVGRELNLSSPKQLQELFFVERKRKSKKLTTTGKQSVDDEVLNALANAGDEVAGKILRFRKRKKLTSTFLDGLLERKGPDGRVHPNYRVTGTVTWRLACQDPNLQNIPDDARMRGVFNTPPGYFFAGADYSQIELLVLAALAEEDTMLGLYNQRTDLHSLIASYIFKIPIEEVTHALRTATKFVVFGLNYGRGVWSIAKQLKIEVYEAQEIIDQYYAAFPKILPWRETQIELAHQRGYVESPFGFRRHLNFNGVEEKVKFELERQAINSPIQGTAAAITNIATIRLEEMYQKGIIKSAPAMTLHDALYFYVPQDSWQEEIKIIRGVMEETVPELGVKPRVAIEVGTRWGDTSLLSKE